MRSKIFTSILALACSLTLSAQGNGPMLDDFDGAGIGLSISYANLDTAAVVANPSKSGINTSDNVLLLDRINDGSQYSLWGAIVYLTPDAAQGTESFNRLFFKAYVNTSAEFYVRVWTAGAQLVESWGQPTQLTVNTWTQISLDLTGLNWNNIDSISLEYGDWTGSADSTKSVTGDGYLTYVDDVELGYYTPEQRYDSIERLTINYVLPENAPLMDDNGVADAAWDEAGDATPIENSLDSLGTQPTAVDISGEFYAVWDSLNVYVLVRVTDNTVVDYTGENPWNNDGIEMFTDGMAYNYIGARVNSQQIQNRFNVGRTDYDGDYDAAGDDTIFFAIAPGGTYNIELKIPFFYFFRSYATDDAGALEYVEQGTSNGDSVGMELSILDNETAGTAVRENLVNWSNPLESDLAYTNSRFWGHLELTGRDTRLNQIKGSDIKVYPNPARNVVNVTMTSLSRVEVCSLDGRVVAQQAAQGGRASVEVSNLSNGMYIIKAIDANNMYTTSKFQKQQ